MKKILGIMVLVLLWCNNVNAETIKYNCRPKNAENFEYVNMSVDFDSKSVWLTSKFKDGEYFEDFYKIGNFNERTVEIYSKKYNETAYFDYATDQTLDLGHTKILLQCKYDSNLARRVINSMFSNTQESSSQKSNLISTSHYNKKQKKLYAKYMSTPEIELCIRYLNNYGWFDDQTVRYTAIFNRGLNCDKYEKLAIDEDKRRNEIADSGKKLLDSTIDNAYGTTGNNGSNKRTHCTTTNVGGMIQVFCKEY